MTFSYFRRARTAVPVFVLAFMFVVGSAQAQVEDAAESDTTTAMQVRMDPIEVTATPFEIAGEAASFAVTTVDRSERDLNTSPSLTLERITDGIPGLYVGSREHYALGDRLTIRGLGWRAQFGVRGVQVLLDGIPITVADGQARDHRPVLCSKHRGHPRTGIHVLGECQRWGCGDVHDAGARCSHRAG